MSEATAPSSGSGSAHPPTVRAAEYVRMSTDHQKYSTHNQSEAIRRYAAQRGFEVVRTYADEGKSGVSLQGRDALKRLIDDVGNKTADFTTILVYDVSRWGRFQDADESAYYEYICRRAGIGVQYCAEPFENDNTPISTIIKSIKRSMAGEYSRELSVKVFAGHCHLVELGFHQGGRAGYGMRRRLVDQSGTPKAELKRGERKSIQTDRVILIPGPAEEVETVRWIFRSFVECGSETQIARILNQRRIPTETGGPWDRTWVHRVLTNEKYIGNNAWNRTSGRLNNKRHRNGPDMWIRGVGATEPIIEKSLFDAAQAVIAKRRHGFSDERMLEGLRQLLQDCGHITAEVIGQAAHLPCPSVYKIRFGGMAEAYQRIGFTPRCDYRYVEANRNLQRMQKRVVAETVAAIEQAGGSVKQDPVTGLLTVNDEITAFVLMLRCRTTTRGRPPHWLIRFAATPPPDILVAVRMNQTNREPRDYYVLPQHAVPTRFLRLAENNGVLLDAYRYHTLEPFFRLVARHRLQEVT
jgi:DNA invertase Pin-like site-specific DNA recombinase